MRVLIGYCLLFLLLALMSCRTEEDTPPVSPVPVIAFKGLTRHPSWAPARPMTGYVGDSINLSIDYQDGDGDLGLSFKDLDSLQNLYDDGKIDDEPFYNYYLELEKKVNGVFRPVLLPSPSFNFWGIFNRVELFSGAFGFQASPNPFSIRTFSPHRGEITYRLILTPHPDPLPGYLLVGDTARFRLHIADRARNVSNTIETTEFVFMK